MTKKELAFYRGYLASIPTIPCNILTTMADFVANNKDKQDFLLKEAELTYGCGSSKGYKVREALEQLGFIQIGDRIRWTDKGRELCEMTEYTIRRNF